MPSTSSVFDKFLSPLIGLLSINRYSRDCPEISDETWTQLGLLRALGNETSGRGFLQDLEYKDFPDMDTGHFFEALKSGRRLNCLKQLNNDLIHSEAAWESINDPFLDCRELEAFQIFAGDGHYHKAPIHDHKVENKKYSTQHFYGVNLRSQMMFQLAVAKYGNGRKKEHDMHMLKGLEIDKLKQGALKGKKTLWVWDRAGMDLRQWFLWKKRGVYFLTREKALNKLDVMAEPEYDMADPINEGIIKNQLVGSNASGEAIRRIEYKDPDTGTVHKYLTNLPANIRPGVVAYIYKRRWDIEKIYNSFKHKFYERRAWAKAPTAKSMQANFICLAQNLTLIMNRKIEQDSKQDNGDTVNKKHTARKKKRIKALRRKCREKGIAPSSLLLNIERLAEMPVVFIRWLRSHLHFCGSYKEAMQALLASCERF